MVLNIPDKNLYILVRDQRLGPFSLIEIETKFKKEEITRSTFLWYPGLLNWITVGDIPSFDRREAAAPPNASPLVEEAGHNQVWIYDQGKVNAVGVEQLRQLIRENRFRRSDLVFDEAHKKWLRSDQHPLFGEITKPVIAPPLVKAVTEPAKPLASGAAPMKTTWPGAENAAVLSSAISSARKAPRSGGWFYSGIGLAAIVAALVYFSGVLDKPIREMATWLSPSAGNRVPASHP